MGEFTPAEQLAIALALRDLEGWGTLYGTLLRYDTVTGERLPEPVRLVGQYDRTSRRGLPANWQALFIARGWLDLLEMGDGRSMWLPTTAGRAIREAWLPEHLKTTEH